CRESSRLTPHLFGPENVEVHPGAQLVEEPALSRRADCLFAFRALGGPSKCLLHGRARGRASQRLACAREQSIVDFYRGAALHAYILTTLDVHKVVAGRATARSDWQTRNEGAGGSN